MPMKLPKPIVAHPSPIVNLPAYITDRAARVDAALEAILPKSTTRPATIHRAMRHSVFAGGKRLRPIL